MACAAAASGPLTLRLGDQREALGLGRERAGADLGRVCRDCLTHARAQVGEAAHEFAEHVGLGFNEYALVMAPLALVSWILTYALLSWCFKGALADEAPALGAWPGPPTATSPSWPWPPHRRGATPSRARHRPSATLPPRSTASHCTLTARSTPTTAPRSSAWSATAPGRRSRTGACA